MSIGERIRILRKRMDLSQKKLAEKAKVSLDTISRWETSKRTPRSIDVAHLAEALHTSIAYLMGETDDSSATYDDAHIYGEDLKYGEHNKQLPTGDAIEAEMLSSYKTSIETIVSHLADRLKTEAIEMNEDTRQFIQRKLHECMCYMEDSDRQEKLA